MKTAKVLGGLAAAAAAGALAMYVFDPESGRRRRALARDQVTHAKRKTREAIAGKAKDLRHRAEGVAARLRARNAASEGPAAEPLEM